MFEGFDHLPKPAVILVCAGLIGIVGVLDYLTGYEISFGIFYFLPIFLATLALGRRAGVAASLLCAVVFFFADYLYRQSYPHPLILYWNAAVHLGFFLIVVFAVSALNAALGLGVAPVSVALVLFILLLELFVAFLQAYVFTFLTAIFTGAAMHPH